MIPPILFESGTDSGAATADLQAVLTTSFLLLVLLEIIYLVTQKAPTRAMLLVMSTLVVVLRLQCTVRPLGQAHFRLSAKDHSVQLSSLGPVGILPPIQLSDSEDEMASRKKKKRNLTLGGALAQLSAARTKGDRVKYSLLKKQIAQEEAHQKKQDNRKQAQEEQRLAHQREQEDKKLEHQMELDAQKLA
jgi:hypothetical protein